MELPREGTCLMENDKLVTWKGRDVETMSAEELRVALTELGRLYTSLLQENFRRARRSFA